MILILIASHAAKHNNHITCSNMVLYDNCTNPMIINNIIGHISDKAHCEFAYRDKSGYTCNFTFDDTMNDLSDLSGISLSAAIW